MTTGGIKLKKRIAMSMIIAAAILLSACQASPEERVVISKNDGAFDANIVQSAQESHGLDATEALSFSDTFLSTDGSVMFQIAVQNTVNSPSMPVVEVVPHFLTEEDARNAAIVEIGRASCRERV